MNATTLSAPLPAHRRLSPLRMVLAVVVAAVFLVAMFVAGRISAPSHTAQPVVTVPSSAQALTPLCRVGRAC